MIRHIWYKVKQLSDCVGLMNLSQSSRWTLKPKWKFLQLLLSVFFSRTSATNFTSSNVELGEACEVFCYIRRIRERNLGFKKSLSLMINQSAEALCYILFTEYQDKKELNEDVTKIKQKHFRKSAVRRNLERM